MGLELEDTIDEINTYDFIVAKEDESVCFTTPDMNDPEVNLRGGPSVTAIEDLEK